MLVLIDGYNLLHAAGYVGGAKLPAKRLQSARTRMLDWLATTTRGRSVTVRVVFDAVHGPAASPEADHAGIKVRFAHRQAADDLIEALLAAEKQPKRVTVVSNDGRLQEAARRRGVAWWSCERFMDWLTEPRPWPQPPVVRPDDKPVPPGGDEEFRRAFGGK